MSDHDNNTNNANNNTQGRPARASGGSPATEPDHIIIDRVRI